ncbi:hypothetical protein O181_094213 [Austropuccinia psidii MF-1]|uniref:Uncharacterized protein n=1 Tax=Austropuccinia psidii MF-1 TaxID=1389203 RepID=A0A9Q3J1N7_9BASI|nr:hypothetical protein [Austropuccinia psidii MF-1]
MPKPLEGGHELLLTHQDLSGSEEDHRTLRTVEPLSCKVSRLEEGIGNDPSVGRRLSGIYQLQNRSRRIKREAKFRRGSYGRESGLALSNQGLTWKAPKG